MNITLAIDNDLVKAAREVAGAMGKSLSQVVREYLEHLTDRDRIERDMRELERLSRAPTRTTATRSGSRDPLSIWLSPLWPRAGAWSLQQILQEYFYVATGKLGVSTDIARAKIEIFGRLDVATIELPTILVPSTSIACTT